MPLLLTRDAFRETVLDRDGHRCVWCGVDADQRPLSAHHLLERRLWPDGGFYADNGVTLCDAGEPGDPLDQVGCHLQAEMTLISPDKLRERAGIRTALLPEQFVPGERLDKWGNPMMASGRRVPGELFREAPVQAMLVAGQVLDLFDERVRYPRTFHHPLSLGAGDDDSYVRDLDALVGQEVICTAKYDGESCQMTRDAIWARSPDSGSHPTRSRVRALWAQVRHDIPAGWRVAGENVQATHSIPLHSLPGPFMLFNIWDERNVALSWDDTLLWADLLGLPVVHTLYRGIYDEAVLMRLAETPPPHADVAEGWVCRVTGEIPYGEWRRRAVKVVRPGHVQTGAAHWRSRNDIPDNDFASPS